VDPAERALSHLPLFPAGTERVVVPNAGHFLPREQPAAVAQAMLRLLAKNP
jgi:pimeloyl-ACP methyl ester carboxylesterase